MWAWNQEGFCRKLRLPLTSESVKAHAKYLSTTELSDPRAK